MNNENKKNILLVEDEVIIAMSEKMELEKYGYTVHHVSTGEKAVKTIYKEVLPTDLILMDINLGSGIDGTEAAKQILDHKEIPIVFLSSHTEKEIVEKTEAITSYGYVVKNSGITVLDTSIKMAFKLFKEKQNNELQKNKLIESENNYRMLFENMNTGFVLFEVVQDENGIPIDLIIKAANKRFENTTGLNLKNSIGKRLTFELPGIEKDEADWIGTYGKIALTGEPQYFESGSELLGYYYNISAFNAGPKLCSVTFTDITERKQAEKKLQKSEAMFRTLFNSTNDTILVMGIEEDGNTTNFKLVNDAACKNLGYTRDELLKLSPNEIDVVGRSGQVPSFGEKLLEEKHLLFESKHITKDGRTFPVEVSLNLFQLDGKPANIAIVRNITNRKKTEQALKENEKKFRDVFESANVGKSITLPNGTIFINQAFANLLGYTKKELENKTWQELTPPDEITKIEAIIDPLLKGKKNSVRFTKRYIHKDGYFVWADISTVMQHNEDGKPLYFITTVLDITEQKKIKEEINKQLKEKELLLKEVHHRVKNNIYNIEAILLLQSASTDNPDVKKALQDAVSCIQSMRILYEKLLLSDDYLDISIKKYAEPLIDSLLTIFILKNEIIIKKNISDFVLSSKKAISIGIIINELMTNVFKHAFKDYDTGKVSISIKKNKNIVTLIIHDNGIGIDNSIIKNKTFGFGLYICKMIVEQLKGTYSIINKNGTKITIQFEL